MTVAAAPAGEAHSRVAGGAQDSVGGVVSTTLTGIATASLSPQTSVTRKVTVWVPRGMVVSSCSPVPRIDPEVPASRIHSNWTMASCVPGVESGSSEEEPSRWTSAPAADSHSAEPTVATREAGGLLIRRVASPW